MRASADARALLAAGLAAIREQFDVPAGFPAEVIAAAERASAARVPTAPTPTARASTSSRSTRHRRRTSIKPSPSNAPASIWCCATPSPTSAGSSTTATPSDTEAWRRGETLYLPDGRAPLYPPVLSERAASLLPDGPRPAVVFVVRIAEDGTATLDGAERAVVRSRAKLAYETVGDADLPDGFAELAARVHDAEFAGGRAASIARAGRRAGG